MTSRCHTTQYPLKPKSSKQKSMKCYPPGILMQNHSSKMSLLARMHNIFAVQPEKLTP